MLLPLICLTCCCSLVYGGEYFLGADTTPNIGKGFYLPSTSIYRLSLGGKTLFKNLPNRCYKSRSEGGKTKAEILFFETPESFYRYLGAESGLIHEDVVAHTFYRTLLDASQSIDPDLAIKGAGIEISKQTTGYDIDPDCLSREALDPQLEMDLAALPEVVEKPEMKGSWAAYEVFLKKYGTHYIRGVFYGNKIVHFVFGKRSKGYSDIEYGAAACKNLRNASLSFCKQYWDSDYEKAATMETGSFYEIRGGTTQARARMTAGYPSSEMLYDFIQGETTGDQDVNLYLEPVSSLLKKRYLGSKHFTKVLNLLQYYDGFVALGCYRENIHGVPSQRFRLVTSDHGIPEYTCEQAKTGCRSDDDCHLAPASFWTACYCYGQSCIVKSSLTIPEYGSHVTRGVRREATGSYYEGENLSCHYQVGPSCYCGKDHQNKWDTIWPPSTSDISRDLETYRQLYSNMNILNGARSVIRDWSVGTVFLTMILLVL